MASSFRPRFFNGWILAGFGTGGLGAVILALLITGNIPIGPLLSVVYYFNPGIDAPDNWAVGLTYVITLATGLCGASAVCLAAGLLQPYRQDRDRKAASADLTPPSGGP